MQTLAVVRQVCLRACEWLLYVLRVISAVALHGDVTDVVINSEKNLTLLKFLEFLSISSIDFIQATSDRRWSWSKHGEQSNLKRMVKLTQTVILQKN